MLSGTGPAERSELTISILINSVICPISSGNLPATRFNVLKKLNTMNSYISITLSFIQTIPDVSVQQAVEEIDEIPELSISQSVAERVAVRSEHRMNTMKPVLYIGRG
jgi:5,10-methylenetetrahydrofolate reductase